MNDVVTEIVDAEEQPVKRLFTIWNLILYRNLTFERELINIDVL